MGRYTRRPILEMRTRSLKERFRNWLIGEDAIHIVDLESNRLDSQDPLRFSIYRANGGTIIETRTWSSKNDENNYRLHVITDDKDLGQEIAKIITMEGLRGG
jgi:hypothetical protein